MPHTEEPSPHPASIEALLQTPQDVAEQMLAARYTPILHFDSQEPFLPQAVGYTIFREDAASPSFPRAVILKPEGERPAELAIEYAIWWDWDIGHLYELEHVWVFVDGRGEVVRVEASWHGGCHSMANGGALALEGTHPHVFSEPGKHAFAAAAEWYEERRRRYQGRESERLAGAGGVWVTPLFAGRLSALRTPPANTLVRTYLQRYRFRPVWDFARRFDIAAELLVPWTALEAWIPLRVAWWVDSLRREILPAERRYWRIAHRGASSHAPENTLSAIRKAADLGADMVEIDVQVSRDGVPVVIHDLDVDRFEGRRGAVRNHSWEELRSIDVGNGERIPTLEEVIECCMEIQLGMYIELKAGDAIAPVVEAIQKYRLQDWAIVNSFRPDWLAWVKAMDGSISTSVLFGAPQVDAIKLAQAVGASYVHPCWENVTANPHKLLTAEWVERVHDAGLGIITWHEERPEEVAALRQLGVDGICSNSPEIL
ncbi:MAG: hypothetical protein D6791_18905 [Chloroflexi bacterium]|nr:MAG: hypothetical protein D6791_18905 [Chloroflexota bacterium]